MEEIGGEIEIFEGEMKKLRVLLDGGSMILKLRWGEIKEWKIGK